MLCCLHTFIIKAPYAEGVNARVGFVDTRPSSLEIAYIPDNTYRHYFCIFNK